MPAPVEPVHLLALLTRVRAERVAAGELAAERLYDVRAFKSALAELGYLRRLAAAGRTGGTVVTSFRQLVAGLAALHPAWRIDGGEGWEDRDRHHRAVRRRLDALQAMGLLRWRVGTDLDGEERRTELELRPAPDVGAEELTAAAERLRRWQVRYGPALNTGSRTGIRNAAGHGRPLSASERQRRGCAHARRAGAARRRAVVGGSGSNSAPPFGAPATPENTVVSSELSEVRNACKRTGVTRTSAPAVRKVNAALNGLDETTGEVKTVGGGEGSGGLSRAVEGPVGSSAAADGPVWDPEALIARVAAREAERWPVLEAIAAQAARRAAEVAEWGLERSWPFARLREAWVVARWGPLAAADAGPSAAGPLYPDDYARLRRAVARYERNRHAAPEGYPPGGLAALLHIGALAGSNQLTGGPRTLRYAVGALDQLSRRMRALASADSAEHARRAAGRARRRRQPPARALALSFRAAWPPWLLLGDDGQPTFDRLGMLRLDPQARYVPPVASDAYRMIVRDAYLLAGRLLPVDVDGRKEMALRHQRQIPPAARRAVRTDDQRELAELAHRTREPLGLLARLSPAYRQAWLARLRAEEAQRAQQDVLAFKAQLQRIADQRGSGLPRG
jgi:hypothetical protein